MIIETNSQYDMRAYRTALEMKDHHWVTDAEVRWSLDAPDTLPTGSVREHIGYGMTQVARRDY